MTDADRSSTTSADVWLTVGLPTSTLWPPTVRPACALDFGWV